MKTVQYTPKRKSRLNRTSLRDVYEYLHFLTYNHGIAITLFY